MPVYVSDRLTATLGVVRGSPTPTRLIQWFRGSTTIAGANASTYTITSDDIGQPISVRQTETNYFGSAVATSAATEDVEVFSPSILFSASEPGVWYDPTDAANLAWRRNLLLWSEAFNESSVWVKASATITANAAVAPDGTMTADLYSGSGTHSVAQALSVTSPGYTISVWVKAFGATNKTFRLAGGGLFSADFIATDEWQRVSFTPTGTGTNNSWGVIRTASAADLSIYLWGAQVELGSTATEYQPITNLNAEVIAQFPNATLYQDVAGTIPVYAPEQPVGLMLDKSRGLVLGPEIVTNGSFATDTDWAKGAGVTISGGKANFANVNIADALYQNCGITAGKLYLITADVVGTGTVSANFGGNAASGATLGSGTATWRLSAASGANGNLVFFAQNFNGTLDNVSVKELPGNHATQSTAISRPLYGIVPQSGRRNLLTFSEQFDNAAWNKVSVTITANAAVAPDGTMTADLDVPAAGTVSPELNRVSAGLTIGAAYAFSVYLKDTGNGSGWFEVTMLNPTSRSWFDIRNGVKGTGDGTILSVGGGWYRCTLPTTLSSTSTTVYITPRSANGSAAAITATAVPYAEVWGAQLELGSTATAYQKVTNDYDVTEAGVASVGYLRFDGTNDFMLTGTITPGTNKVQVFSGVRKLSDAAIGIVAETSVSSGLNADTFYVAAPESTGASGDFRFKSRGSVDAGPPTSGTYLAPTTRVLTGLGDISSDTAILRINGTQVVAATGDQGTGNYLAYPLYLGMRAGTSLPFNGQLFPLIVRFGPTMSSALVRTTENWVASKTAGVVLS